MKRFSITVSDGVNSDLEKWAAQDGRVKSHLAVYLIERGIEEAKVRGDFVSLSEADRIKHASIQKVLKAFVLGDEPECSDLILAAQALQLNPNDLPAFRSQLKEWRRTNTQSKEQTD